VFFAADLFFCLFTISAFYSDAGATQTAMRESAASQAYRVRFATWIDRPSSCVCTSRFGRFVSFIVLDSLTVATYLLELRRFDASSAEDPHSRLYFDDPTQRSQFQRCRAMPLAAGHKLFAPAHSGPFLSEGRP